MTSGIRSSEAARMWTGRHKRHPVRVPCVPVPTYAQEVFPVPIAEASMYTADESISAGDYLPGTVVLWAAWNNARSEEGKPPTFTHLKFCRVGLLHDGAKFLYN